jgi:hypothetical protein
MARSTSPFRDLAPSLARLKSLYSYDPDTGIFRLTSGRGGYPAGKVAGTLSNTGYLIIAVDGVRHPAHRLAWLYVHGFWPPAYIDHVNRDRADNRICNLRLATQSQNNVNSCLRSDNSTGHKGVAFDVRRNRYRAYIVLNGKQKHLGRFREFDKACAAYDRAAAELFGEFASAA